MKILKRIWSYLYSYIIYGAPKNIRCLNTLRHNFEHNFFIKGTPKKSCVQLASLPPTIDAAIKHCKQVYLQIQLWVENAISPLE